MNIENLKSQHPDLFLEVMSLGAKACGKELPPSVIAEFSRATVWASAHAATSEARNIKAFEDALDERLGIGAYENKKI